MQKYLVVMPYSWGTGDTISKAEKIARQEGAHGRKKVEKKVFMYDTDKTTECYINGMGGLCWSGDRPIEIKL
jgi:hypothetical protein